jgi:hypothetical protein
MSVYFVYRSHYEGPSGKHVRRLDGDSVLGWFQAVWERAKQADDTSEWVTSEIGTGVYGFASIFEAAREESLPPPTSDRKLKSYLEDHLYVEGEFKYKPHALQVLTDDDEIELAYYIFDDHFLAEHPGLAAYLLHEDWRLPITSSERPYDPAIEAKTIEPSGDDEGTTFLAFLAFYDSLNLTDLDVEGPWRIDGVRLPGLMDFLGEAMPGEGWPFELKLLRSQLPQDTHGAAGLQTALERVARFSLLQIGGSMLTSKIGLGAVEQAAAEFEGILGSLKEQQGRPDPLKSLISTGDHIAQLCLFVGWGGGVYHQWIVFDDFWAGGHPDLADGVLRYAKRWDVLS